MPTRREIVQSGAALAAIAPIAAAPAKAASGKSLPIYKVVFDQRTSAGRNFAAEAKRLGADVHATSGEMTGFFRNELRDQWQKAPAAIAGFTTYNSLFALELIANDLGMRVIYRADHQQQNNDAASHTMFGPNQVIAKLGPLGGTESDWAAAAARNVLAWPANAITTARTQSNIGSAKSRAVPSGTLVSWIIAPVKRTPFPVGA